jgi:hypothetical protein
MPDNSARPRVFVSSVIEGYEHIRAAAAGGIADAGGEPVMAERLPSLAVSPRNACLDGVRTSDVYLVLLGARAGWSTPSGALATEEEFDEAQKLGRPSLVFVEQTEKREERAAQFVRKVSDYVTGRFRRQFADAGDLRTKVEEAVRVLRGDMELPLAEQSRALELLEAEQERSHDLFARVTFVPERRVDLISPDRLDSKDLVLDLYERGLDRKVQFFDHALARSAAISREGILEIVQRDERGRAHGSAALSLSEAGEIALNAGIREAGGRDSIRASMSILEGHLASALKRVFLFASATFGLIDPHERCSTVWAAAGIVGADNRYLYRDPPSGNSMPVRTGGGGRVMADKVPRKLTRVQLREPDSEIERLIALFRRQIGFRDEP